MNDKDEFDKKPFRVQMHTPQSVSEHRYADILMIKEAIGEGVQKIEVTFCEWDKLSAAQAEIEHLQSRWEFAVTTSSEFQFRLFEERKRMKTLAGVINKISEHCHSCDMRPNCCCSHQQLKLLVKDFLQGESMKKNEP